MITLLDKAIHMQIIAVGGNRGIPSISIILSSQSQTKREQHTAWMHLGHLISERRHGQHTIVDAGRMTEQLLTALATEGAFVGKP